MEERKKHYSHDPKQNEMNIEMFYTRITEYASNTLDTHSPHALSNENKTTERSTNSFSVYTFTTNNV